MSFLSALQSPVRASGGTVTDITENGINYRVHTFTSNGTFEVVNGGKVESLIVAGGGGGGSDNSGGGGAGGLLYYGLEKFANGVPISISTGSYSVIVGQGGTGTVDSGGNTPPYAENGENSSVFGLTAIGGGAGASGEFDSAGAQDAAASDGGSGGGGAGEATPKEGGSGTAGQGNDGGTANNDAGGGGGGAGGPGQDGGVRDNNSNRGGAGGPGLESSISGSASFYAAGGDGGNNNQDFFQYSRPSGIGGQTNLNGTSRATSGIPNTGSGGGGSTHTTSASPAGGDGGSGIVIIRYPLIVDPYEVDDFEYLSDGQNIDGVNGWLDASGNVNATSSFSQTYTWTSPGDRFLRWTSVNKGDAVKNIKPHAYKKITFYAGIDGTNGNNDVHITFRSNNQDLLDVKFTDTGGGGEGDLSVNNNFIADQNTGNFAVDGATHFFDLILDYTSETISGTVTQLQTDTTLNVNVNFLNSAEVIDELYVWTVSSDFGHLDALVLQK